MLYITSSTVWSIIESWSRVCVVLIYIAAEELQGYFIHAGSANG